MAQDVRNVGTETAIRRKFELAHSFVSRGAQVFPYLMDRTGHDALMEMLSLYNPIGGPIRKIFSYLTGPGRLHSNVGAVAFSDLDRLLRKLSGSPSLDPATKDAISAGGKGFSLFDMFAGSGGEAFERVVGSLGSYVRPQPTAFGTYRELTGRGFPCLHPDEVPLFSRRQHAESGFLYDPFTVDAPIEWMEGHRLLSESPVWVPSQLVEMLHLSVEGEARVGYSSSGGLSSHTSREMAIYHGIREILERDALNLRWYLKIPPDEIVVDSPPQDAKLRVLLDDLVSQPGEIKLLYHPLDITEVPVVTAVRIETWMNTFAFCAGAGADNNPERAVVEAIAEFGQSERMIRLNTLAANRPLAKLFHYRFGMSADAPLAEMTTYVKSMGYYGNREVRDMLRWHVEPGNQVSLAKLGDTVPLDAAANLARVGAALGRHGIDPIVIDFTPRDLCHLKLIRVFMPQVTQPFLQSRPMLGHPRFQEIAKKYGGRTEAPRAVPPLPYP